MPGALPELYFRTRDNGALVFRVDGENRQRRIEMDQIAVVNLAKGEVRPHGEHVLTSEELEAIAGWVQERLALLARRRLDDVHRSIDALHVTTQWVQSRASDAELDEVTDALLLAMHDLRGVLVRRKAEKLSREG